MTLSYQKINLVVFIVLAVVKEGASGLGTERGPTATAEEWQDQQAAAAACPVQYASTEAQGSFPLLLGGVEASCRSGCQPRTGSAW